MRVGLALAGSPLGSNAAGAGPAGPLPGPLGAQGSASAPAMVPLGGLLDDAG
jgi:hypothetical protein